MRQIRRGGRCGSLQDRGWHQHPVLFGVQVTGGGIASVLDEILLSAAGEKDAPVFTAQDAHEMFVGAGIKDSGAPLCDYCPERGRGCIEGMVGRYRVYQCKRIVDTHETFVMYKRNLPRKC